MTQPCEKYTLFASRIVGFHGLKAGKPIPIGHKQIGPSLIEGSFMINFDLKNRTGHVIKNGEQFYANELNGTLVDMIKT